MQIAIAATMVTAVVAAGSVLEWMGPARKLRWVTLLALVALSVAWALRRGGRIPDRRAFATLAAFAGLAFVSAAWSADPRLTIGRAGALTLVLVAAAALSFGAVGSPETVERVLTGVLAGAVAIAVGGLLVLAFRYDRAVQAATTVSPARYQGLGGGPNMAPMVLAIAAPLALHALLVARSRGGRIVTGAILALLLGSIAFSGSRGAFAALAAGLAVYALLGGGRRLRRLAVVAALTVAAVALSQLPQTAATNPPVATGQDPNPAQVTPAPGYVDANVAGPRLQDDIGHPGVGVADTRRRERTLLGSSGRTEAWRGAIQLAADRPALGYGFGTEDRTFVDRYVFFNSGVPENSYIGIALQLGAIGLILFALVAWTLIRPAVRVAPVGVAAASVFVAALVLGLFQSYLYAAGNAATVGAWVAGLAAVALGSPRP